MLNVSIVGKNRHYFFFNNFVRHSMTCVSDKMLDMAAKNVTDVHLEI